MVCHLDWAGSFVVRWQVISRQNVDHRDISMFCGCLPWLKGTTVLFHCGGMTWRYINSYRPISQIPQCTCSTSHISVLNGALWDMEEVHCGICELGQLMWLEYRFAVGKLSLNSCLLFQASSATFAQPREIQWCQKWSQWKSILPLCGSPGRFWRFICE